MIADLVIDQEGKRLYILEEGKNAEKKCCWYWTISLQEWELCLTAWRGRGEDIMDWKMSHESSHWQNPTSFQYEFKEHSGEKVSVRDIPKSQGCGERAAQQAQLCLGTGAKAGQGRDEHHCS